VKGFSPVFAPRWTGPYQVWQVWDKGSYRLRPHPRFSGKKTPGQLRNPVVETSPRYVRQVGSTLGRARGWAREIRHLSRASVRDVFVRHVSIRHASRSRRRRRRRCPVGGKPCLYKIEVSSSESIKSIKTAHALTFQHHQSMEDALKNMRIGRCYSNFGKTLMYVQVLWSFPLF